MKLTKEEIQQLYTFTRQHFVEYYDLQTELVDHLANDIEEQWQKYPKLNFEDAKNNAFKKFGIFGFMDAIEQKGKAMNKRYVKYLWNELKKWFELPQLLATIALFLIFYLAFASEFAVVFALIFYVFLAGWSIIKGFQLKRYFKRKNEFSKKKWMLEELIFKQAGGASILFITQIGNIFIISDSTLSSSFTIVGFSLVFTLISLINYISLEIIPNKAENLLNETYPEFCL
jgi:hypothetical protein